MYAGSSFKVLNITVFLMNYVTYMKQTKIMNFCYDQKKKKTRKKTLNINKTKITTPVTATTKQDTGKHYKLTRISGGEAVTTDSAPTHNHTQERLSLSPLAFSCLSCEV